MFDAKIITLKRPSCWV